MSDSHQRISIVIPIHNESSNISLLHKELSRAVNRLPYDFKFIFVDDGSTDNSTAMLDKLQSHDPRIHYLEFSRNFGKEAALSAGLHVADGVAVVIMDADLQHPPKLIHKFIEKWEQGAEVVIGIRQYSNKESYMKRLSSELYYFFMNSIAHANIKPHATDFRLLDHRVVEAFGELTERNRMTRGIIDWLGFNKAVVSFVAPPRNRGQASYTYKKLAGLALNSLTSYSMLPLRLAGYLGLLILFVSAPIGIFVVIEKYIFNDPYHLNITGTAILALLLLFLIGIVLTCLGLIALYIAQIHVEVTNRPLYVLREQHTYRLKNETANSVEASEKVVRDTAGLPAIEDMEVT